MAKNRGKPDGQSSSFSSLKDSPSMLKKEKKVKGPRGSNASTGCEQNTTIISDEVTARKSTALAFIVLSKEDSEEILGMSAEMMESKLQQTFQLNPSTDLKDAAVLDYYVGATYWCKQQGFTPQQLSGFFTVVHNLLDRVKDHQSSLIDVFKDFRKALVGINAESGPDVESGGLEFFNSDQAKSITDYLHGSLFQHFKLYECMFSHPQTMEIVSSELSVEVPLPADTPFPPPLDEGISESTYKEFLSLPTPSRSSTTDEAKPLQDEEEPATPIEVELPPEAQDLFRKLDSDDVRAIIQDVSVELLLNLQNGVEQKLRSYETNVLNRINKIHVVLQESTDPESAEK